MVNTRSHDPYSPVETGKKSTRKPRKSAPKKAPAAAPVTETAEPESDAPDSPEDLDAALAQLDAEAGDTK